MNWTSREEKKILEEWASIKSNENIRENMLSGFDDALETYFESHSSSDLIVEYDFSTLPELKNILENHFADDVYEDLLTPLCAATMRGRKIIKKQSECQNNMKTTDKNFKIPEFIYAF